MKGDIPAYRLACITHDLGKLQTRADGLTDDSHSAASATVLREELNAPEAARIVECHHDERPPEEIDHEVALLQAADTLSTQPQSEADTGAGAGKGRLGDVFQALGTSKDRQYPLKPLALDRNTLFAGDNLTVETADKYKNLYRELTRNIDPEISYDRLLAMIEKYAWCVPNRIDGGDPLYDHLRMTTAFGDALAQSNLSTESLMRIGSGDTVDTDLFTLVKGDLSGIQDFIQQVRSQDEAQERFAKRTRGRSLQLWLLTESLARYLLVKFNLPPSSLVWSGGGQFYAVVPPHSQKVINEFETEVNEWLLERFGVDLLLVVGTATANSTAASFPSLFRQAAADTNEQKFQKASPIADTLNTAVRGPPVEPCRSCGRDNHTDNDRCQTCQLQEHLGEQVAAATHLSVTGSEDKDADFTLRLPEHTFSWRITEHPTNADRCYRLNSTDIDNEDGFLFTGTAVPHGGAVDRVWSFHELADLSRSDGEYVHICKMDIDSLGTAISTGIDGGPTQLAALSRALTRFFSGYVNNIANEFSYQYVPDRGDDSSTEIPDTTEERKVDHTVGPGPESIGRYMRADGKVREGLDETNVENVSPIYIGFSGGDDMFFVGPWDDAVMFARRIREEFTEYTGGALTLSGGFFLTHPSYPIGRGIEQAEQHLNRAKRFEYGNNQKNAATLFSETLAWEMPDSEHMGMEELLQQGEWFETLIKSDRMSRSTLDDLRQIREQEYPQHILFSDVSIQKDASWQLKYLLARHFDGELLVKLEESLPPALPWLNIPVAWASLATRG